MIRFIFAFIIYSTTAIANDTTEYLPVPKECKPVSRIVQGQFFETNSIPDCVKEGRCTEKQAGSLAIFIHSAASDFPRLFNELRLRFDSSAYWREKVCEEMNGLKTVIINSFRSIINEKDLSVEAGKLIEVSAQAVLDLYAHEFEFNKKWDEASLSKRKRLGFPAPAIDPALEKLWLENRTAAIAFDERVIKEAQRMELQRLAEAKAAKEKEASRKLAEKNRKEDALKLAELQRTSLLKKFDDNYNSLFQVEGIVPFLINSTGVNQKKYSDANLHDLLMMAMKAWSSSLKDSLPEPYKATPKDEFETSLAYEKRIANERAAYEDKVLVDTKNINRISLLKEALESYLGKIKIDNLRYDADHETFNAAVISGSGALITEATLSVPLSEAKAVKEQLAKASLAMRGQLSGIDDNHLVIDMPVLAYRNEKEPAQSFMFVLDAKKISIDVSDTAIKAWEHEFNAKVEARRKQKEATELAERKRTAVSYPYTARFRCSLGALRLCLGASGEIRYMVDNRQATLNASSLGMENEVEVLLSPRFEIFATNGNGRMRTLSVTVEDTVSLKTMMYQETSQAFGVIKISD
ncbi:hypothetical protein WG68_15860 [Arsukibacterium ikkense]|uniref:Uncharacterized protein n=1 Tax=Arsukibacterium ikkense TaxID=336831 RepID=A0A0M2V1Q8_9GAMM|nr:hypothetical protein [Arsukibacterium ikkense]KKO44304.1 hypothetical protein WG68_15860 [Arsukibacterium ikkense]